MKPRRGGGDNPDTYYWMEDSQSERIKEFLRSVDFELIKGKFREIAKRCGVKDEDMNFVEPDKVFEMVGGHEHGGEFFPEPQEIGIAAEHLDQASDPVVYALLLRLVGHEEAHALMHDKHVRSDREPTGYHRGRAFRLWNEGVTDKFAKEAMIEYGREKGIDLSQVKGKYESSILLVEAIIKRMSQATGVSEQTVWQAIIRGGIERQNMKDPELQKDLEAILGKGIFAKLERAKEDDLGLMIKQISFANITSGAVMRIKKLLGLQAQ